MFRFTLFKLKLTLFPVAFVLLLVLLFSLFSLPYMDDSLIFLFDALVEMPLLTLLPEGSRASRELAPGRFSLMLSLLRTARTGVLSPLDGAGVGADGSTAFMFRLMSFGLENCTELFPLSIMSVL